jgi:hypothetical protein
MTQEECVQVREINATHQSASRTRRALRFVGTAIGEPEVVQEQVHRLNPLTPELNPSAQRCLTRFFTGDFAS